MYPGVDYSKLASQSVGDTGQFTQGIDPNWTALANAYGFIQNPFPRAGTEGQDQMRFLATLKNIMDSQLGGQGGLYNQMSPNNPIASMPFGMRQWFAGASPLFQSIQGRMLMPMDQANMLANGYQFGGINTGTENALMQALRTQREGGPVGQNQAATDSATTPAGGQTTSAAEQVSGGADTTNNPPDNGAAGEANSGGASQQSAASASNTTQSIPTQSPGSGTADIADALKQADINAQGGVGNQAYGPQEVTPAGAAATRVGEKASDLGSSIQNVIQTVNSWDVNTRRALANAILNAGKG